MNAEDLRKFFNECKALPDKQLSAFKEKIIPDIEYVCKQLQVQMPTVDISMRNWMCAQIDLHWQDRDLSVNVMHDGDYVDDWMLSEETRRAHLQCLLQNVTD